jgi:hypothetical protein
VYWREERENWRATVFFAVLMLHAVIGTILLRWSSTLLSATRITPEQFLIRFLGPAEPREAAESNPERRAPGAVAAKRAYITHAAPMSEAAPDKQPGAPGEITLLAPIDWTREAELAARSSLDAAEREKRYRNLAGLSAAQLKWIEKNHMEPVDTNPPWAETAPRNNSDGVVWISNSCALVNLLPVCRIQIGRKAPRGDLFKNMRQYLEERVTDPLP